MFFNSAFFWRLPFLVVALAAFMGQALICHVENAGLIRCVHAQAQDCEEEKEPSGETSTKPPINGCYHAGCHNPVSVPVVFSIATLIPDHHPEQYPAVEEVLPESPVEEIDYPPRLS
jgi:hypothetical protein